MTTETTERVAATLAELAAQIRTQHATLKMAAASVLAAGLDAGDALIAAKAQVSVDWQAWVVDNCAMSLASAKVYMRLAHHRAEIEAEIERAGELSLRRALRLIRGPGTQSQTSKPKLPLLMAWGLATREERRAALSRIDITEFFEAMPHHWRVQIEARVGARSINNPSKATTILRKALSLVKTASTPGISDAMAKSNRHEAIASLHQLTVLLMRDGVDLNEIAISTTQAKSWQRAA